MSKKRQKRTRSKIYLAALLLFVSFSFYLMVFGVVGAKAQSDVKQKYYTSITVQPGDSLWEIAETYAPEYGDIRDYVRQLKVLNGLNHSENLLPGQSLLVIYYK